MVARIQGSGCRVQGSGFRVQGQVRRVQGAGCRVQGAGCRVQGTGCRISDLGRLEDTEGEGPHPERCTLHPALCTLHPESCTVAFSHSVLKVRAGMATWVSLSTPSEKVESLSLLGGSPPSWPCSCSLMSCLPRSGFRVHLAGNKLISVQRS